MIRWVVVLDGRVMGVVDDDGHQWWLAGLRSRSQSRRKSKIFGWSRSRISNNTGSQRRIFLSDSDSGGPIRSFFTSHS